LETAYTQQGRAQLLHGESYTAQLKSGLDVRVCADSRPHNLKISPLQKGLVLVKDGKELIEEGIGFGVPVAIYSDKTYFSSSAQVFIYESEKSKVIEKKFLLDASSRRKWRIASLVENPFYKSVSRFLENTYINYPNSRRIILPLIGLKNKIGVKTEFTRSIPRAEVTVTYKIKQDQLDIEADLSKLNKEGLKRLILLNEQGSTFFRKLVKPDSPDQVDEEIGAWNPIANRYASFTDLENSLIFSLQNLPKSRLFVGREYFKGITAWAGLQYEVESISGKFSYRIQFSYGGNNHD
jgi:hypothetical protein